MAGNVLAAAILLLFGSGCAASRTFPGNITRAIRNPEAMRATLASQVVGRPLADAQKFMEQEAFACSLVRQGSFQHGPDGERDVRQGIDYLHCRREDPDRDSCLVGWDWNVALVLENDMVMDVMAYAYGRGP